MYYKLKKKKKKPLTERVSRKCAVSIQSYYYTYDTHKAGTDRYIVDGASPGLRLAAVRKNRPPSGFFCIL